MSVQEGTFIQPGSDAGSDVTQDDTQLASSAPASGVSVWLIVGASMGGALLCIIIIVLAVRRWARNKRRNSLETLDLDYALQAQSKSAPCTRSTTPQIRRKESMPETTSSKASLIRSVTVDTIPGFTLPPERVQPNDRNFLRSRSENAIQYQQNFLASFQPQLYSSMVDDDNLDASGGNDDSGISGSLWFTVLHDAAVEQLTVSLIKAKHLKGRGRSNGARDPFVKLYLLPDERTCQQTRVRKKTLNPKFNETFTFNVEASEASTRTLRMSVYDVDKRRVRHSLGHVILPLSEVDLASPELIVKPLENMSQSSSAGLGEIYLSLMWNPTTERIQITVIKAKNLTKLDYDTEDGMYARAQYISGGKVKKTKSTVKVPGSCDPVYNEALSFPLPNKQLESVSFCVTVLTCKSEGGEGDLEYGEVVLGSYIHARGEELLHWQEMLAQPRNPVARWHHLTHTPPPDSKGHFSS